VIERGFWDIADCGRITVRGVVGRWWRALHVFNLERCGTGPCKLKRLPCALARRCWQRMVEVGTSLVVLIRNLFHDIRSYHFDGCQIDIDIRGELARQVRHQRQQSDIFHVATKVLVEALGFCYDFAAERASCGAVVQLMLLTQFDERRKLCVGELRLVFCSEVVLERAPRRHGLGTSEQALEDSSMRTPDMCGPRFRVCIAYVLRITIRMEAYIRLEVLQVVLSEAVSV
jgi:hypothetical protein